MLADVAVAVCSWVEGTPMCTVTRLQQEASCTSHSTALRGHLHRRVLQPRQPLLTCIVAAVNWPSQTDLELNSRPLWVHRPALQWIERLSGECICCGAQVLLANQEKRAGSLHAWVPPWPVQVNHVVHWHAFCMHICVVVAGNVGTLSWYTGTASSGCGGCPAYAYLDGDVTKWLRSG